MQVGHEIRSPGGRSVLQKTSKFLDVSPRNTLSIFGYILCGNNFKHAIREAGIGCQIGDLVWINLPMLPTTSFCFVWDQQDSFTFCHWIYIQHLFSSLAQYDIRIMCSLSISSAALSHSSLFLEICQRCSSVESSPSNLNSDIGQRPNSYVTTDCWRKFVQNFRKIFWTGILGWAVGSFQGFINPRQLLENRLWNKKKSLFEQVTNFFSG